MMIALLPTTTSPLLPTPQRSVQGVMPQESLRRLKMLQDSSPLVPMAVNGAVPLPFTATITVTVSLHQAFTLICLTHLPCVHTKSSLNRKSQLQHSKRQAHVGGLRATVVGPPTSGGKPSTQTYQSCPKMRTSWCCTAQQVGLPVVEVVTMAQP